MPHVWNQSLKTGKYQIFMETTKGSCTSPCNHWILEYMIWHCQFLAYTGPGHNLKSPEWAVYCNSKWRVINPWSPGVERNIGFLGTIYVPPGLQGLVHLPFLWDKQGHSILGLLTLAAQHHSRYHVAWQLCAVQRLYSWVCWAFTTHLEWVINYWRLTRSSTKDYCNVIEWVCVPHKNENCRKNSLYFFHVYWLYAYLFLNLFPCLFIICFPQ